MLRALRFAPLLTLVPVLVACTALTATPQPTPDVTAAAIWGLFEAINTKSADAALSFLADDPEIYQRDAYKKGHEKVVIWLREEIDDYRDHFEIIEMKTDGPRAAGLVRVTSAGSVSYFKASEYLFTFQALVRTGKIECLNIGQPVPGLC